METTLQAQRGQDPQREILVSEVNENLDLMPGKFSAIRIFPSECITFVIIWQGRMSAAQLLGEWN